MQDTDRRAVKLGLGAVMLWSTVATAFSLSLQYLTPLQLVTLATFISWCFFAIRLSAPERRSALRVTSYKARATGLLVGWLNPGLCYLVLFAAYDQLLMGYHTGTPRGATAASAFKCGGATSSLHQL